MRIATILLTMLVVLSCDNEKVEICRLSSISYNINGNPNLKVVITLTRNLQGLITKIDFKNKTYRLEYNNSILSTVRIRNEDKYAGDSDYLFTYRKNEININVKMYFPEGQFNTHVTLLKSDLGEIVEKIIKNENNKVTWHEKYLWENGNISKTEIYYDGSVAETNFFEYDDYVNPMNEFGIIFLRPELMSRNNVILISSLTEPISNYSYSYNSKGFPVNYKLPIELGTGYSGQLNYSGCE